MINFTVGPVQMNENVLKVSGNQIPYFRTEEFSEIMLENEKYIKRYADARESDKVVFLTASSSGAMEAAVMNIFNCDDKVLIINGGSFGQRFVDICKTHGIKNEVLKLYSGQKLTQELLDKYSNSDFTALLVNICETSTGTLYDYKMIGEFCKKNNMLYICDCVSSFIADKFSITQGNVDVFITGSQKALACAPGISILALSERVINKINKNKVKSTYFDLKSALSNAVRGQTPFTPAVGILLQINERLKGIENNGGLEAERLKIKNLASHFRENIQDLPLKIFSENPSNCVTALEVQNDSAYEIFEILKNQYGIWICPNGGNLKNKVFRVGHIGALNVNDNNKLICCLYDLHNNNIF